MRTVTQTACKEVSIFEYLGGFQAVLQTKVFCSPYWQENCCREVETPRGKMIRIDHDTYPPGGKSQTAMRRCSICGKWAPRDVTEPACPDCITETQEQVFAEHLRLIREDGEYGLIRALLRLHWKRHYIRPRKANDDGGPDESAFLPDHLIELQDDSLLPMTPEMLTFPEQQTTSGRHWLAEVLDMPEKPVQRTSAGAVARTIRRHLLWAAKDSPRRAIGCSVILLPESEEKLREEIIHYETTGHIEARATRQDTVSPRIRYREKPA